MRPFEIPSDPLQRFLDIFEALEAKRTWTMSVFPLRYSALTLATSAAPPEQLADELFAMASQLKDRAGWFGPLNSPIRFTVAAMLLRRGDDPAEFCEFVDTCSAQMRELKLRAGSIYETIALLILRDQLEDVSFNHLIRFKDLYEEMKKHHWWLTGPDDYPACALLTTTEERVREISRRVELFYDGLRNLGFSRGEKLQTISHILYFCPQQDVDVLARFEQTHKAFKKVGLWIHQGDWDEIAILCFLDHEIDQIVSKVLEHRAKIRKAKPAPDADTSFGLACGTAFLELVRLDQDLKIIQDAASLAQVQAIIAAQQAAVAAAAASTAAIAASSASH
ncbi:MAG: DUF4003 family protein [Planctomycetota bacterium]